MTDENMSAKIVSEKPTKESTSTSGKAIASLILGLSSFLCFFFTGLPAILIGIFALTDIKKAAGKLKGDALAIGGIILGSLGCLWAIPVLIALLLPAVQSVREVARQEVTRNNLREVAIGMHNFADVYKRLPDVGEVNDEQASKLSWRVQILPFLGQQQLHDRFNHNEPWDSPTNKALIGEMPKVYESVSHPLKPGHTLFVLPVTPFLENGQPDLNNRTAFVPQRRNRFESIVDGTASTIMLLEVSPEAAVVWTQPSDWEFDPDNPRRDLGTTRQGRFIAAMADGSVQIFDGSLTDANVKSLMTAAGNEPRIKIEN